jgi:hypothetical protein
MGPPKEKYTHDELEAMLVIDTNALDVEVVNHPDLFYRVSRQYAELMSRRDAAKTVLEETEAQVTLEARELAVGSKVTVAEIDATVRMDQRVRRATADYNNLSAETARAQALKEAYQQRSYAFGQLIDLQTTNYFGVNPKGRTEARDRLSARARR